jgi:hypothetical protein
VKTSDIVPISLTRRELYDLVWTAPMAEAAARLGISRTWLTKICHRADVPYPNRTYWELQASGKRPAMPPLLKAQADEVIVLRPRARLRHPDGAEETGETAAHRPGRLHPILTAWREELLWRREEQMRRQPWVKPEAPPAEFERRRFFILDQLIRELESRGHDIRRAVAASARLCLNIDARLFEVSLSGESVPPRAAEVRETADAADKPWLAPMPTTRLVLEIASVSDPQTGERWVEEADAPLEGRLGEIVEGAHELIRRSEAHHVRQLVSLTPDDPHAGDPEGQRWQALSRLAAHWAAVDSVRRLIERLKRSALERQGALTPQQAAWLEWAEGRIAESSVEPEMDELIAAIEEAAPTGRRAKRSKSR